MSEQAQQPAHERFKAACRFFQLWVRETSGNLQADCLAMEAYSLCHAWEWHADETLCAALVQHCNAIRQTAQGYLKLDKSGHELNLAIADFWQRHDARNAARKAA
jgi:hypothetical protein